MFKCSTGAWYEDEVEEFIQRHALAYARDRAELAHRLLLFETEREGLVAVGAHELAVFRRGQERLSGSYLVVGAIALAHHGARLEDGGRLSDFLVDAVLADARRFDRGSVVHARVARENARSLALLRRRGFVHEIAASDPRYIDLVGSTGS